MTANALLGDREACIGAGMDDYIVKPVQVAKLRAAINRGAEHVSAQVATVAAAAATPAPTQAPAPPNSGQAIDLAALAHFGDLSRPDEAPMVIELIDLFLDDAPSQIGKMTTAAAAGDRETLHLAAHTLKGSAINIGAPLLAGACDKLEQQAKADSHPQERELLSQVAVEFERVRSALETIKAGARR
jgi:HPt (histidine-containing phosphotransfer) domain-containing protein